MQAPARGNVSIACSIVLLEDVGAGRVDDQVCSCARLLVVEFTVFVSPSPYVVTRFVTLPESRGGMIARRQREGKGQSREEER